MNQCLGVNKTKHKQNNKKKENNGYNTSRDYTFFKDIKTHFSLFINNSEHGLKKKALWSAGNLYVLNTFLLV